MQLSVNCDLPETLPLSLMDLRRGVIAFRAFRGRAIGGFHGGGLSFRTLATLAATAAAAAAAAALARARERVAHARSRLRLLSPAALVERGYLRLDDMANRLGSALRGYLHGRRQALARAAALLERASPETRIQIESHRLLALSKRLRGASPVSVLNRGFAIVRDAAGRPVMRAAALPAGTRGEAEFADGKVPFRTEAGPAGPSSPRDFPPEERG